MPIDYDAECPFKYNNFVYKVKLASPMTAEQSVRGKSDQPGCVTIPEGTEVLVMRLANSTADGMNTRNRVENEVAVISIVSAAFKKMDLNLVPEVYGWGSASDKSSQGWIMQKFMPGANLSETTEGLDLDDKKTVFAQMAKILKAIQEHELPLSITGFGGLSYDKQGRIVSDVMTTVDEGPWDTYEQSFEGRLRVALRKSDDNPYIKGWRANGIRERLEAFIEKGLHEQFKSLSSPEAKTIIHADFSEYHRTFVHAAQY